MLKENLTKKRVGSRIRKKFIPDPVSGDKKKHRIPDKEPQHCIEP
jgi:hypothetical protein